MINAPPCVEYAKVKGAVHILFRRQSLPAFVRGEGLKVYIFSERKSIFRSAIEETVSIFLLPCPQT